MALDLARITGELPNVLARQGQHHRPLLLRRIRTAMPRPSIRVVLLMVAAAELAGAAGWTVGYGPSPAGAIAAGNGLLLLTVRWAVR